MGQVGSLARPSRGPAETVAEPVAPVYISLAPPEAPPCVPDTDFSKPQALALMALVLRKAWLLDYFSKALSGADRDVAASSVRAVQLVRVRFSPLMQ